MGLDSNGLGIIFQSLVVSKILYALPAIFGLYTESDLELINSVFRKAHRWGLTETQNSIQALAETADERLFHSTLYNPQHCLHQLLTIPSEAPYDLRPRGHPYPTPQCHTDLYKLTFINRSLFKFK